MNMSLAGETLRGTFQTTSEYRMTVQPTIVSYPGDGSTKNFTFQFDYISTEYVKVRVDGVDAPFTFTAEKAVALSTAPGIGETLVISRETERSRLVDFTDGSVLIEDDLDLSATQTLHIVQEALDLAGASLTLEADGSLGASFRRVSNVGAPTSANDAITKEWAETAMSSQLALAAGHAAAAASSESAVASSASAAAGAASDAAGSASTASAASSAASSDASAAAASAGSAAASASTATSQAAAASASASVAAAAADSITQDAEQARAASTLNMFADPTLNDATRWRSHYGQAASGYFGQALDGGGTGYVFSPGSGDFQYAWWYQKPAIWVPLGRRYRMTIEYKLSADALTRVYLTAVKENLTVNQSEVYFTGIADNTWRTGSVDIDGDTMLNVLNGGGGAVATDVQFGFAINHPDPTDNSSGMVRNIRLEDITESYSAAQSAAAAAAIDPADFAKKFNQSAETTITVNTTMQAAHGLGAVPKEFGVFFVCKTADGIYSPGDWVKPVDQNVSGFSNPIWANATHVKFKSTQSVIGLIEANPITPANWRLVFWWSE